MSVSRIRTLYSENIFRAQIVCKNVAPPDDKWAEGVLCTDDNGTFYILNRKAGDGVYDCCEVDISFIGLSSGFSDGEGLDIFEGDIVSVDFFETDEVLANPELDENGEWVIPERETYIYAPEYEKTIRTICGVAFMSGGVFYIQYFDEDAQMLTAMPLHMLYAYDGKPVPGCAVRIEGNVYDNDELYKQTLKIQNSAYSG